MMTSINQVPVLSNMKKPNLFVEGRCMPQAESSVDTESKKKFSLEVFFFSNWENYIDYRPIFCKILL